MTVHQSPITVNGWQGSGYSVIDPEMGVGAYQISGGASGGFAVLGKVINALSFLAGAAEAISAHAGIAKMALPAIANIVKFLDVAKLTHSMLTIGLKCKSLIETIMLVTAAVTLFTIAIVSLTLAMTNPIAAFVTGSALEQLLNKAFDYTGTLECP